MTGMHVAYSSNYGYEMVDKDGITFDGRNTNESSNVDYNTNKIKPVFDSFVVVKDAVKSEIKLARDNDPDIVNNHRWHFNTISYAPNDEGYIRFELIISIKNCVITHDENHLTSTTLGFKPYIQINNQDSFFMNNDLFYNKYRGNFEGYINTYFDDY